MSTTMENVGNQSSSGAEVRKQVLGLLESYTSTNGTITKRSIVNNILKENSISVSGGMFNSIVNGYQKAHDVELEYSPSGLRRQMERIAARFAHNSSIEEVKAELAKKGDRESENPAEVQTHRNQWAIFKLFVRQKWRDELTMDDFKHFVTDKPLSKKNEKAVEFASELVGRNKKNYKHTGTIQAFLANPPSVTAEQAAMLETVATNGKLFNEIVSRISAEKDVKIPKSPAKTKSDEILAEAHKISGAELLEQADNIIKKNDNGIPNQILWNALTFMNEGKSYGKNDQGKNYNTILKNHQVFDNYFEIPIEQRQKKMKEQSQTQGQGRGM